jgi:hypothetical protein
MLVGRRRRHHRDTDDAGVGATADECRADAHHGGTAELHHRATDDSRATTDRSATDSDAVADRAAADDPSEHDPAGAESCPSGAARGNPAVAPRGR